MKKIILLITCLLPLISFSQNEKKFLFAIKVKSEQIENKVGVMVQNDETQDLIKGVSKGFANLSDDLVDMPYELERAFRSPTAFGIAYKSFEYYGVTKDGLFSTVMVAELKDYDVFKEGLSAEDAKTIFLEKDGLIEVYENKVFTDKKKLIIVNTERLNYSYGSPKLVNNKDEALSTESMKCTEAEYAKQIAVPLEERDFSEYHSYGFCGDWYDGANIHYNLGKEIKPEELTNPEYSGAIEAVEKALKEGALEEKTTEGVYEATETAVEVTEAAEAVESAADAVVESTERYEKPVDEKKWYQVEYYRNYIIVENREMANVFFENKQISTSEAYLKYKTSKADQAYWLNNEGVLEMYSDLIDEEMGSVNYLMTSFSEQLSILKGSSMMGELFYKNGKAELTNYSYGNAEFLSSTKKINSERVSKKLTKYLPADSPAYMGSALDVNELFSEYEDYFKKGLGSVYGYDSIAQESYELLKLIMDEDALSKLYTGQTLVYLDGYYDFEKHYTDYSYDDDYNYVKKDAMKIERRPSVYSFFGTEDPESWKRVCRVLEQTGFVERQGDIYTAFDRSKKKRYSSREPREVGFYFTVVEDAVVFSSSKDGIKKIAEGKYNAPSKAQKKNLKKYGTYLNVNMVSLSNYLEQSSWFTGRDGLKAVSEMKQYKNFEVKGIEYGSNYVSTTMSFTAKNTDVNILTSFYNSFQFLND